MNTFTQSQKQIDLNNNRDDQVSAMKVLIVFSLLIMLCVGIVIKSVSVLTEPESKCEVKRVVGDKHHPFHKICKE